MIEFNKIYNCDCLEGMKLLPDNYVDLIVTSPPYNQSLSTQGNSELYSDELDEEEYNAFMKSVLIECYRVLKHNGSMFYNYKTDVYKNKLRPAFEHLIKVKGEFLVSAEIVWKYAGNFDSAKTRFPTDYEMIYHLTKSPDFKFNYSNNISSVWRIKHVMGGSREKADAGVHPCPFPLELVRKVLGYCSEKDDLVLDPFMGSGTTALACKQLRRRFIGFETNSLYCEIAKKRLSQITLFGFGVVLEREQVVGGKE